MLRDAPNIQALWGDLIVEELVRKAVREFVVCPGSRSTPLVQAIARNPLANATVCMDERGAAFYALGYARGQGWPAAVVTTSGTAVANLLPAVVEASLDSVPLILLTADRPPELRGVGANQSIPQVGIFSDHVRWAFHLPVPGADTPARSVLTTIGHAVARAMEGHPGPVHVNCPFREPLAPSAQPWDADYLSDLAPWLDGTDALANGPAPRAQAAVSDEFVHAIRQARRGLLICATSPWAFFEAPTFELAEQLGWPVYVDIRSNLRLGGGIPGQALHVDRMLEADASVHPDVVIQLGSRITSKRLLDALSTASAQTYAIVDPSPERVDPTHCASDRFTADISEWCERLLELLKEDAPGAAPSEVLELDARIEEEIESAVMGGDAFSEPYVVRWITRNLHEDHGLFLSNSMPIRDAQNFADGEGRMVFVGSNRGASGIDGILSTAAGFAQGDGWPATLITGDLALLHDINALAMLKQLEQPLTIVVLNNGGGSIFSFLPIAEHEDVLDPLVNTPHAITFDGVCASFDIPHTHVADRASFEAAYEEAVRAGVPWVIEVDSSLAGNKAEHDRIEAAIAKAIRGA